MIDHTVIGLAAPSAPIHYRALRGTDHRKALAGLLRKIRRENSKMGVLFLKKWRQAQSTAVDALWLRGELIVQTTGGLAYNASTATCVT